MKHTDKAGIYIEINSPKERKELVDWFNTVQETKYSFYSVDEYKYVLLTRAMIHHTNEVYTQTFKCKSIEEFKELGILYKNFKKLN